MSKNNIKTTVIQTTLEILNSKLHIFEYCLILDFCTSFAFYMLFLIAQPLRAVGVLYSPMVSRWAGWWWGKDCPGCISETIKCRKLILGRDIGLGV